MPSAWRARWGFRSGACTGGSPNLGRTYQAVLDDFRAGEAERLLLDGRVPLAQVALALGFADQTAFSRAFRRWKGETPKDWLAQRRAERAR